MTLLKNGKIMIPNPAIATTAWGAFVTAITAVNDGMAYVCQAPLTGTIDFLKFWTGTNAVAGTIDVRIETVDATTGHPTGTLWGTNTNGAVTLNAATTEFTATLTAGAVVNKGDIFAIVFRNPASSPASFQIRSSGEVLAAIFPYAERQISGTWTKTSSDLAVALHYSTGGGQYAELNSGHAIAAATAPSTVTGFNSGSNPNRQGNKFVAAAAYNVTGAWAFMTPTTTSDFVIELVDSNNTVVATTGTIDSSKSRFANGLYFYEFQTNYILIPGATYRIVLRAATANNLTIDYIPLAAAAYGPSSLGAGNFLGTSSGNGTTWTDSTVNIMFIGLICDGVDLKETNRGFAA